jgi:hypothetical protein
LHQLPLKHGFGGPPLVFRAAHLKHVRVRCFHKKWPVIQHMGLMLSKRIWWMSLVFSKFLHSRCSHGFRAHASLVCSVVMSLCAAFQVQTKHPPCACFDCAPHVMFSSICFFHIKASKRMLCMRAILSSARHGSVGSPIIWRARCATGAHAWVMPVAHRC